MLMDIFTQKQFSFSNLLYFFTLQLFPGQVDRPYSWALYLLFHSHFTQILHTASILLTLSLAVWRYIAIKLVLLNLIKIIRTLHLR